MHRFSATPPPAYTLISTAVRWADATNRLNLPRQPRNLPQQRPNPHPHLSPTDFMDIADRQACADLVQKWGLARDQGRWDELLATFHPDGVIAVSWFRGRF